MVRLLSKIMLLSLFMFTGFSCSDKKDNDNLTVVPSNISGQWRVIITPDQSYQDTILIKGHRGSDFEVSSSELDEVYLYQNGTNVLGFSGPFKLSGTVSGNKLTLTLFTDPDGEYLPERPIGEMKQFSTINLTVDNYGMMEGTGNYFPYEVYPKIVNDTYKVKARRTNTTSPHKQSLSGGKSTIAVADWKNDLCNLIYSITSFVITDITDGIVRPMSSSCWLTKAGGGYYIFGTQGPGSMFPILTQSIYFPLEWSFCKVREYDFNISIGGENITYSALKNSVINSPPVKDLISKLGFTGTPQLEQALDDFYNQFGGFAISMFYDTNTNDLGLYVNISQGNSTDAEVSTLVQGIKSSFGKYSSSVFVQAGQSINDSWHLRRSPLLVCNTPIIILYVLGTNKVNYN